MDAGLRQRVLARQHEIALSCSRGNDSVLDARIHLSIVKQRCGPPALLAVRLDSTEKHAAERHAAQAEAYYE